MAALTADFDAPYVDGKIRSIPVAAGVKIYAGALVVMNAGYAAPGTTATGLIALGRAEHQVDNTGGAAGALSVKVRRGPVAWNSGAGGDAITEANIGANAYIIDDNTVGLTNGGGGGAATRSVAGRIYNIDAVSGNVFIEII
jgi:hypothetical protein